MYVKNSSCKHIEWSLFCDILLLDSHVTLDLKLEPVAVGSTSIKYYVRNQYVIVGNKYPTVFVGLRVVN